MFRPHQWLVALTLWLAVFGGWVSPALADDSLVLGSDPIAHQQLSVPPGWVTVAFRKQVDAGVAKVVVTNSDGATVSINELIIEGTNVTTQLMSDLPKGTYTVHYRVDRTDGDIEGGAFQFSYGKGSWTKLPDARWKGSSSEPTVLQSNEPPISETPTPSASPTDSTPTPSGAATPGSTASATPAPGATPDGGAPWLLPALGVGLVILLGGGAAALLVARKKKATDDPTGQ